ncbi:MAG: exonuclease SbcCD subunit D [archaeon]
MRFAHIADCHVGGFREQLLADVSVSAFIRAIDICIEKKVEFILIAGDLFNTSLPSIDVLKTAVRKLRELKQHGIAVYYVAGSHDFSPSGKTVLDVLEEAGFCHNVVKGSVQDNRLVLAFTQDPKTSAKITGMIGKKGMLEKSFYESLDKANLEEEPGFKIFMFHTALTELKPAELSKMDSAPVSLLPKGFSYYAGGHVHSIIQQELPGRSPIVYPGPLFPHNFAELEKLKYGGFFIYDEGRLERIDIKLKAAHSIIVDCSNKPVNAVQELLSKETEGDFTDMIVLIRLHGILESGKPSEIDFKELFRKFYDKGAYFVMKNTNALASKEFQEIVVQPGSVQDVENALLEEHLGQTKVEGWDIEKERETTKVLLDALALEREEDERVADFEKRIRQEAEKILKI